MRNFSKILAVFFALIICVCTCGCNDKIDSFVFTAFNCQITVCSYSKKISPKTENFIKQFAGDTQNRFDLSIASSFTSKLNTLDENQSLPISNEEYQILTTTKKAYELSNGKFDPTVYPLVKLWGFAPYKYTLNYTPPTDEQINLALEKVNFNAVNVTENGVTKNDKDVCLDFGGIVKGFVADGIAKILKDNGHTDGYISVGTSSLHLISVANLNVRHPENGTKTLFTVNCTGRNNLSVSTSGNYEKFHIGTNGEKYCHIIDPQTGYTAKTGVASATLIGVDGTLADALTTAICLTEYSPNETENPLNELLSTIKTQFVGAKFFVAVIKDNCKMLLTNANAQSDFTLHDQEFSVTNI